MGSPLPGDWKYSASVELRKQYLDQNPYSVTHFELHDEEQKHHLKLPKRICPHKDETSPAVHHNLTPHQAAL